MRFKIGLLITTLFISISTAHAQSLSSIAAKSGVKNSPLFQRQLKAKQNTILIELYVNSLGHPISVSKDDIREGLETRYPYFSQRTIKLKKDEMQMILANEEKDAVFPLIREKLRQGQRISTDISKI